MTNEVPGVLNWSHQRDALKSAFVNRKRSVHIYGTESSYSHHFQPVIDSVAREVFGESSFIVPIDTYNIDANTPLQIALTLCQGFEIGSPSLVDPGTSTLLSNISAEGNIDIHDVEISINGMFPNFTPSLVQCKSHLRRKLRERNDLTGHVIVFLNAHQMSEEQSNVLYANLWPDLISELTRNGLCVVYLYTSSDGAIKRAQGLPQRADVKVVLPSEISELEYLDDLTALFQTGFGGVEPDHARSVASVMTRIHDTPRKLYVSLGELSADGQEVSS